MSDFNSSHRIRRAEHKSNYTTILNDTVRDVRLSWKARGLHHYILSLPSTWDINIAHLSKQSDKDGIDIVKSALKELEACGYISKEQIRGIGGKFETTQWNVYEEPQVASPQVVQPQVEKPHAVEPSSVNPSLRIIDKEELSKEEITNMERSIFSQLKVAESETPTPYRIDQLPNQVSTLQAQTKATSSQLPLSQNPDPEISAKGQDQEKTPPHGSAAPPLIVEAPPEPKAGKAKSTKKKKRELTPEQKEGFLAVYLEEKISSYLNHKSVPPDAFPSLLDVIDQFPDNYFDVVRGALIYAREKGDRYPDWLKDDDGKLKRGDMSWIFKNGKAQKYYEHHLDRMENDISYRRRVEGELQSMDVGRHQVVVGSDGKPVSAGMAEMYETIKNADQALLDVLNFDTTDLYDF